MNQITKPLYYLPYPIRPTSQYLGQNKNPKLYIYGIIQSKYTEERVNGPKERDA